MMRAITVWVDEEPYKLNIADEVEKLVGLLPVEKGFALATGQAYLGDSAGHEVGSGGGLADGHRLYVIYKNEGNRLSAAGS